MAAAWDLGEVVLQHESSGLLVGRQAVQICRNGFVGQSGGLTGAAVAGRVASVTATWWEVVSVKRIDRTDRINGATTSDAVWIHVGLTGGRTFVFCGKRDAPGAVHAAHALFTTAKAFADRHIFAELDAGRPVYFGRDVRASWVGIEVKRGSAWSMLRREEIAGYRVYQATLMIDQDHARPRLFAQLFLGKLDNGETLIELLGRIAPDKDLDRFPYRVPGSVWRTSAVTHDPRYVSTRTRMMFMVAPLALLAAMLVLSIPLRIVGSMRQRAQDEAAAAGRAGVARQLAAMADAPVPQRSVGEACAGSTASTIDRVYVVAAPDVEGLPPGATPFRMTLGANAALVPDWSDSDFGVKIEHVVLARVLPGSRIVKDGMSEARMHVRRIEQSSGRVVCEGVAEGHWRLAGTGDPKPDELDRGVQRGLARLSVAGFCADAITDVCSAALGDRGGFFFVMGPAPTPPPASASASGAAGRPARPTSAARPAKPAAPRSSTSASSPAPASDEDRAVVTIVR
jgi:hypothetical protein